MRFRHLHFRALHFQGWSCCPMLSATAKVTMASFRRDPNTHTPRFHLTPVAGTKHLPRAWERKPATPFVPRTESHKIWKRYALRSNKTSDSKAGFSASRITGFDKESTHTVRTVKRQRNIHGATATRLEEEVGTGQRKSRRRKPTKPLWSDHWVQERDADGEA